MKFFLILSALMTFVSCGIKGKPLPPLPEEPLPAVEVEKTETVSTTVVKPLKTLPVKKKTQ